MSATKLTETQQIVLCAAARRDDRCVMLPPRLKGAAAQKVVKKLVDLGLIEEVRARGDLPVWRRDHDGGPRALRITGGYSGGSTDRPALQQLLADIRARKIDVVVVYKVDRLTRSLADFAKLVELFDAHGSRSSRSPSSSTRPPRWGG